MNDRKRQQVACRACKEKEGTILVQGGKIST
nr:MAG TPA: Myogenic Basic domain [Caudoviricetes sp.]